MVAADKEATFIDKNQSIHCKTDILYNAYLNADNNKCSCFVQHKLAGCIYPWSFITQLFRSG
jgi:hypothetical protein